jgi:hypothetical protein
MVKAPNSQLVNLRAFLVVPFTQGLNDKYTDVRGVLSWCLCFGINSVKAVLRTN